MKFLKEFKEFALKGNVLDMAIGLVIGGAFQTIITSLVQDIIMPFTALFTGNVDYADWVIKVSTAEIRIGSFITALINFIILALSVFLALKVVMGINKRLDKMNKDTLGKVTKKFIKNDKGEKVEVDVEPLTKECPYCFSEIKYKATRCPQCTAELEKAIKEAIKE